MINHNYFFLKNKGSSRISCCPSIPSRCMCKQISKIVIIDFASNSFILISNFKFKEYIAQKMVIIIFHKCKICESTNDIVIWIELTF